MIKIDPTARFSPFADIEESHSWNDYLIGSGVIIVALVKFKPAGGLGDIVIGANVLIAANCTLAATNHSFKEPDTQIRMQGFQKSRGGILIEEDIWIGANSVLLDGTHVGRGAVVAAGSVVRGLVAAHTVQGGNPLRIIQQRAAR